MASPGTDVKLSEDRVKGYRNFLNKLWNANNFLITNECDFSDIDKVPNLSVNINKWIYAELIEAKSKIEKNLKIIDLMKLQKMLINLRGIHIVTGIWNYQKQYYFQIMKKLNLKLEKYQVMYSNKY
jgi:valyl-tRNA synthetase